MTIARALVVAALAASAVAAESQSRDLASVTMTGTGAIGGTVVAEDETRAPVRRAIVTLVRSGAPDVRTTATDDKGQYAFAELPAGSYEVRAIKGGYLSNSMGATRPGMPGRSISLAEGQRFAATPIPLMRGAVVAGRLLDRRGQPAAGREVTAAQFLDLSGERRGRGVPGASGSAATNAHGEYRIYGLLPGEYIVFARAGDSEVREVVAAELKWAQQPTGATPVPARGFTYAPTAYPGTADAGAATPVRLTRGEERLGVDFQLRDVPVSRVSGVVTAPDGKPAANIIVSRFPRQRSRFFGDVIPSTRSGQDGSFTFTSVPPGEFVIFARGVLGAVMPASARVGGPAPASPPLWTSTDLQVSGQDVSGLGLRLQSGMSVSGRVAFANQGTPPVDPARIILRLAPFDSVFTPGGATSTNVRPDGSFRIEDVPPGSYRFTATLLSSPASGWRLKSAMLGATDIVDVPFEVRPSQDVAGVAVTFTDTPSEISGNLVDSAGQPTPQYYVFVFPVDRTGWIAGSRRIASARATLAGAYSLVGLPAGEYFLCALTEVERELQSDPSYLEQLIPASIKISLSDGQKITQHLRVGG